ncbi:MAG TPA: L-seryl-tRNA(Sec) selenium transferase [Terriglobales bacterium]|nr:L-seryl-tRNA(Sec) selenium transferase [Terriglobales bacterium]
MPNPTTTAKADLFRKLPSVDELSHSAELAPFVSENGQTAVNDAARAVLARLRNEINANRLDSAAIDLALSGIADAIERQLRVSLSYSLQPVINATGVILHTNLGRAPLAAAALDHIHKTAFTYSNLEFDLESGERGKRDIHVDRLFRKLLNTHVGTAAQACPERSRRGSPDEQRSSISTVVVNNNAAAVLLALNTLAEGGEAIVSRGELVEIGGSFRIPDVMSKSSAILREVGTTNRTRVSDYERAINDKTKLLLRVHRSNFQITGFTEQPSISELAGLARRHNLPLMEDLGSGALFDLRSIGINDEPSVLDSLEAGVDVVTYSGDKLLGGPQAGILSGRSDLISRMRANSLFRALRGDKLIYAALEATLLAYVKRDRDAIPALKMMRLSKEEIASRAEAVAAEISSPKLNIEIVDGESVIGGGAAPSATLPTKLLAITSLKFSVDDISSRLRKTNPSIIARVEEGRVLLDLRTVFPEQDEILKRALLEICNS